MAIASQIKQYMADSSWIRRMFELGIAMKRERGEENVFDLSLGNPVMEPPPEFMAEMRRLLDELPAGSHRYMPNAGYVETRAAVASALAEETGLAYGAQHVLMTVGAGGGINAVLHALCEPDDEVVIFAPFFAEYLFYAVNHGAKSVAVGCGAAFTPDLAELEAKITPRTKVVMVNSPNNPSGRVYPDTFIRDLGALLQRKGHELETEIYLLSDEPYRKIIFDDQPYPFPQLAYDKTITVTSHSKDLALPGERIGYVAVHPDYEGAAELMDAFVFCNRVLGFVNAPAMMQHVVRALQHVTVDVSDYQRKRDYLYGVLTEAGYEVFKPEGAFYMFPKSPVEDEMVLVEALQRHGVLVVPGRGFGMPGYFRISYCVDQHVLEGAVPGFQAVAKELGASS
ncbi:MAG: pyridoxal phosphate-dependent aminotransferase [Chloroflexi bacterium]|nr:pyridoxal phosphate-dependent aminotransferase [Chloroflexota bacterium]